jgi:hypothetical protein
VLVFGAYLANSVDTSQRPAIGLAALAAAGLAVVSARAERNTRARIDELNEARRRDAQRVRTELDEAHARSQRAVERAMAAESAVQTLMAATEGLLAVRHALMAAAPAVAAPVEPLPVWTAPAGIGPEQSPPAPLSSPLPDGATLAPVPEPGQAPAQQPDQQPIFAPAAAFLPVPAPYTPAVALAEPPPTLVWPLADLPEPRRPSLDLPLIPAPVARVSPLFVPVESPAQRGVTPTTSTSGAEPRGASELVDVTSTSTTRFARPA